jgi:kynurenine formamidase
MNLSFPNHSGTHIDFPYHFNPEGKAINDYPASYWQFDHVELADLSNKVVDCQIIGPEFFPALGNLEADLLLIKTGYGKYRGTDRYTLTPPGLSADLALFFRNRFPKLRCIGMDLISVSSYSNREEGRKAHHAFLKPNEGEPILLIEDMKLDTNGPFNKVIVAPLLIDNADGSPCTIISYSD